MAAIAFDPLEYTHALEASGVPREQAEVHAKAITAMFIHNFDALVTKDYLDTRFNEFETRVGARFDSMASDTDRRFASVDARFDSLETHLESRMDLLFERIDGKISRIYLMFGLTMVTATIPILQNFFGG